LGAESADPPASDAGTVNVTVVDVTVGSDVRGYPVYVPFPVPSEDTEILVLSMVAGSTVPDGKEMVIVPDPATKAAETPKVTFHDVPEFTLELAGTKSTLWTFVAKSAEPCTCDVENMPRANIVATAAIAMSSASPKVVPILVFIYSYLLVLHT